VPFTFNVASSAIAACTVWCDGGKLGCRFDEPLERDLFRSLTLVFD